MVARNQIHLVINQPISDGNDYPLRQPAAPLAFGHTFDEVTFTVSLHAVLGAPTAWKLEARPLFRIEHVGGPNTGGFQYRNGRWYPLDAANVANCIVEKAGYHGPGHPAPAAGEWGTIADNVSNPELAKANFYTNPDTFLTVQRTFQHFGADVAIEFRLTFTGGTNPRMSVALQTHGKG